CASKAAVIQLTKAMAVEFAAHKIRVNSVSPGYILTELVEPYTEYHALWEPKIPLGRLGRPEELTGLYLYLASEASSYMTGSDIVRDGGYPCIWAVGAGFPGCTPRAQPAEIKPIAWAAAAAAISSMPTTIEGSAQKPRLISSPRDTAATRRACRRPISARPDNESTGTPSTDTGSRGPGTLETHNANWRGLACRRVTKRLSDGTWVNSRSSRSSRSASPCSLRRCVAAWMSRSR